MVVHQAVVCAHNVAARTDAVVFLFSLNEPLVVMVNRHLRNNCAKFRTVSYMPFATTTISALQVNSEKMVAELDGKFLVWSKKTTIIAMNMKRNKLYIARDTNCKTS